MTSIRCGLVVRFADCRGTSCTGLAVRQFVKLNVGLVFCCSTYKVFTR